MFSPSQTTVIKTVLAVNLLLISFSLYHIFSDSRALIQIPQNFSTKNTSSSPYQFKDPALAYEILTQLDLPIPYDNGWTSQEAAKKYQTSFFGLTSDYKYCEKHRANYVHNPTSLFTQINFMSGWQNIVRKQVLKTIGNDIMPKTSSAVTKIAPDSPQAVDLKPEVNLIASWEQMQFRRQVQTQFGCLAQMVDHIPGLARIKTKDRLSESLYEYEASYKARPQCFDADNFFPKTYALTKPEQCKEFFEIFNGEKYQEMKKNQSIVYFRKIGASVHAASGVFPVDEKEEIKIAERYQNGSLCGKIKDNNLMQYYIHNPLLLNGRKFDFRIFMLIASVNPLVVYYHDGILRVSLSEYSPDNSSRMSVMPNANENDKLIKMASLKGKYQGKTAAQIKEDYMWSLKRLQDYLLKQGKITDKNWLDNYLRPQFKKAMVHLMRMAKNDYLKISSVYELQGLDFVMDENLNLWFIETNPGPAIETVTPFSTELFRTMFLDIYDIVIGLLRSRMKRVNEYVNKVIERKEAVMGENGEIEIKDLNEKLKEWKEVSKNYFEPEFKPKKKNTFQKIIDENETGVKRYSGLIAEECL